MFVHLPVSVRALTGVVSEPNTRYAATQNVHVVVKDGLYTAEATDGRMLIRIQGPERQTQRVAGLVADMDHNEDITECFIPRSAISGLKCKHNHFGLGVSLDEQQRHAMTMSSGFDTSTTQTVPANGGGHFPNIDKVIPKAKPIATFRLCTKNATRILSALSSLVDAVDVIVYDDTTPIRFRGNNGEHEFIVDALLVPLTMKEKKVEPEVPSPKDYRELKEKNEHCMLVFRVGDGYRLYSADAKLAAPLLGAKLSHTNRGVSITPFLHFSEELLETTLERLTSNGYNVAMVNLRHDGWQIRIVHEATPEQSEEKPEVTVTTKQRGRRDKKAGKLPAGDDAAQEQTPPVPSDTEEEACETATVSV